MVAVEAMAVEQRPLPSAQGSSSSSGAGRAAA
jgi:hypothetical protein